MDGKTGRPLIDPPVRDTVGAQASSLTVSVEGRGNDLFLYWSADCENHTGQGGEFKFVEGRRDLYHGGRGNDLFLYWSADCENHTGQGGEFKFVEGRRSFVKVGRVSSWWAGQRFYWSADCENHTGQGGEL